jgi:hypothetical protein
MYEELKLVDGEMWYAYVIVLFVGPFGFAIQIGKTKGKNIESTYCPTDVGHGWTYVTLF